MQIDLTKDELVALAVAGRVLLKQGASSPVDSPALRQAVARVRKQLLAAYPPVDRGTVVE